MAVNDYWETSGAPGKAANGPADDLKALFDELAVQITVADERHSGEFNHMQARVNALADRAATAKPDVPEHCAITFERVESAISSLAGRLANKGPIARRSPSFDHADPDHDLPDEVRADVRRAIFDAGRDPAVPPPVLRSALSVAGSRTPPERLIEPAKRQPFGESGEETSRAAISDTAWGREMVEALARPCGDAPSAPTKPAPVAPSAPAIDRSWLEGRFADIAGRVEQSLASLNPHNTLLAIGTRFDQLEQRFDTAINHMATRVDTDVDALRSVEKQITDLTAQLDRAHTQLGRLDHIERRVSELRQSVSEEQMTKLIGALAPSDEAMSAVAMAAAERVAEQIRAHDGARAAPAAEADPRLGELTTLLQEFIDEQRRGDANTAESLDTMQLAMQHLIDRVEAIETLQTETRDAYANAAPAAPRYSEPTSNARTNAAPLVAQPAPRPDHVQSSPSHPAHATHGVVIDGVRIVIPPNSPRDEVQADSTPSAAPAGRTLLAASPTLPARTEAAEPASVPPARPVALSSGTADRAALIAMARSAAEKASNSTPPAHRITTTDEAKPKPTGRIAAMMAKGSARRPGILLVASFAAFLLAGFWMVAGTSLRGVLPGAGQSTAPTAAPTSRQQGRLPSDTTSPSQSAPAPRAQRQFPGMGRVVEGGVGITIEERPRPVDPEAALRVREQIQTASLSARIGEEQAVRAATTEMPTAASSESAPPPSGMPGPAMVRTVELPPAMIGPLSLRHAAAKGDAAAQFEVASRFAEGKGVAQDFAQAATWYQRAATHGLATAQYRLGALYERGLGVAADPARARVWYGRAAEQGSVRAMHNLAVLSAGNSSGSADYPLAVQWFTEAASQGLADSQYNLGILYESGLGVPTSNVEAYKWYALAARSGDKDAARRRDAVRGKLDSAGIRAADALVVSWRAKPAERSTNTGRPARHVWQAPAQ